MAIAGWLAGCGRPDSPEAAAGKPGSATNFQTVAVSRPIFEDVSAQSGLAFTHQLADGKLSNIMESDGAGGAILDYDGDGWMDVYLVNSGPHPVYSDAPASTQRQPNRLFRNLGEGRFEDVTAKAGVAGHGFGTAAAAADYDNDGDMDLLALNFGGCILYRNRGDGTFEDRTTAAGLQMTNACISASFADIDKDGLLDLFIANYLVYDPGIKVPAGSPVPYPGPTIYPFEFNRLLRNRGDGTFEDVSEAAGVRIPGHRAMAVTALDCDKDGDADFYVANDGTANLLLINDGKGRFRDMAALHGVAFNQFGEAGGSMGTAVADCNGDGLSDMLVTRFGQPSLYVNVTKGIFEDQIAPSGLLGLASDTVGWGGSFLDWDNDGDLDVFIVNGDLHFDKGMLSLLAENTGKGAFRTASTRGGAFFNRTVNCRGLGVFDMNNDGGLDAVVTTLGASAVVLKNQTARGNWLMLSLHGQKSNRHGWGAWVVAHANGRAWEMEARCPTTYVFQGDPRLHLGLGQIQSVERIEIRWPSGVTQTLGAVAANQVIQIREP